MSKLPAGWQAKTVKDICTLQNGNGFKPSEWSDNGLPIIRIQHLNGSKDFNYFSGTPKPNWLISPGEILFAWAGTKGVSFGPFIWTGPQGVLNQHIFRTTPSDAVDKDWLYYSLKQLTFEIEGKAHGFKATLLHVSKGDIEDQEVYVPSHHEQTKIAQILSTWDKAIATTERLLANSQQQKDMLTNQLLTGQQRFSEFVTSKDYQQTFHGPIPRDWSYVPIADIANQQSKANSTQADLPVLSCSKYDGLVDSLKYFKKKVYSDDTSKYRVVEFGDFAYPSNHIEVETEERRHRTDTHGNGFLHRLPPDAQKAGGHEIGQVRPGEIAPGHHESADHEEHHHRDVAAVERPAIAQEDVGGGDVARQHEAVAIDNHQRGDDAQQQEVVASLRQV